MYCSSAEHSSQLLFAYCGRAWTALQLPEQLTKGLTHLPLRDGQPKGYCWPSPTYPAADPRNVSWGKDSPVESDCPPDCCTLVLTKYYFWHHRQPKPQIVTLWPKSARFPEIPAMDFFHTLTQELRKEKAKCKCRSYWWWSAKPHLSIQPGEAAVS